MKPLSHLTVRVAWHDSKWNGSVCEQPALNSFCTALPRIRESKKAEEEKPGERFDKLPPDQLPPCKAESGFFMSPHPWVREFDHPYRQNKNCAETHGNMKKRLLTVPAFSAVAVPFNWMLRRSQKQIDQNLPQPLAVDEKPPFASAWIFGRKRQEAVVDLVFGKLTEEKSLALFYTKEGHPLGDGIRRLVVGIGRITKLGKREHYDTVDGKQGYPLWDRVIGHSIRTDGDDGFLLPYHDYLCPTGDANEDARRASLVNEIVVAPPENHQGDFSFGAELTDADVALSILSRALVSVRNIREHGIVPGPWQKREAWLNQQISLAWKDRGAFPGTGAALEAIGMRLGTVFILELRGNGTLKPESDPWPVLDEIFKGKRQLPDKAFAADIQAAAPTWLGLNAQRRNLLSLLSRFDLTAAQAKRTWEETKRRAAFTLPTTDEEILGNPYILPERDLGGGDDAPVSLEIIDRGLLPDEALANAPKVPEPSNVAAASDRRRVRCALVTVLRKGAIEGDALLSLEEALGRLPALSASNPILITPDWIEGNAQFLDGVVSRLPVEVKGDRPKTVPALQLTDIKQREEKLAKILRARCGKVIQPPKTDWQKLITDSIEANGQKIDVKNARHMAALTEQAKALEKICSRRLSVLTGSAGTGKTSVVGGLVNCEALQNEGLLLLAPTGKARVRLQGATKSEAMTVAQFLHRLKRYDSSRQRPLYDGKDTYREAKTVVVDEASMLTMDTLYAVLQALDLTHVQRIILVGDPNQLPPIGVGRPFADLVTCLSAASSSENQEEKYLSEALARLTVEVRSVRVASVANQEKPSDTLRLASWFTDLPPDGFAEEVLSRLSLGETLNDLEIAHWSTSEDLRKKLIEQFQKHLGLNGPNDVAGFNKSLPKSSRLLSRELVYTALTRSRQKMVLLVEGNDLGLLHDLSRPERSDACRRNTNLFTGILRERSGEPPHAENLIHKTDQGHMVRSKSELIIANLLHGEGIKYEYEKTLDGETILGRLHPDFSFADAGGDRVIWEHLGMMHDEEYVRGWRWKVEWYRQNGFVLGQNLFVSEERRGEGLKMEVLRSISEKIKALVA